MNGLTNEQARSFLQGTLWVMGFQTEGWRGDMIVNIAPSKYDIPFNEAPRFVFRCPCGRIIHEPVPMMLAPLTKPDLLRVAGRLAAEMQAHVEGE